MRAPALPNAAGPAPFGAAGQQPVEPRGSVQQQPEPAAVDAFDLPAQVAPEPPAAQVLPGGGDGTSVRNPAGQVLPGGGTGAAVSNPAGSVLPGGAANTNPVNAPPQ